MIKFILLFLLSQSALGTITEDKVGKSGYQLNVDLGDGNCCIDKDERDHSDAFCLGDKNSKKVADAVIFVIKNNHQHHLNVLMDLKLFEFFAGTLSYAGFSNHIRTHTFNYKGYDRLKQLISKLRVCSKVCKVFFFLRKSLLENAAEAEVTKFQNEDDGSSGLAITSDLIMVSDVITQLEEMLKSDPTIKQVIFDASAIVFDSSFAHEYWHAKDIIFKAQKLVFVKSVMIDATGIYEAGESDGYVYTCGNPERTLFDGVTVMSFPEIVDENC